MLFWSHSHGNSIRFNRELVFLINNYYGAGFQLHKENLKETIGLFVARALVQPSGAKLWVSAQNRYLAPSSHKE